MQCLWVELAWFPGRLYMYCKYHASDFFNATCKLYRHTTYEDWYWQYFNLNSIYTKSTLFIVVPPAVEAEWVFGPVLCCVRCRLTPQTSWSLSASFPAHCGGLAADFTVCARRAAKTVSQSCVVLHNPSEMREKDVFTLFQWIVHFARYLFRICEGRWCEDF